MPASGQGLSWEQWAAIYASVLSTTQLGYTVFRHFVEDSEKTKQEAKINFKVKRVQRSGFYDLHLQLVNPGGGYALILTNAGGSAVVITEVVINGEPMSKGLGSLVNLPVSLGAASSFHIDLSRVFIQSTPLTVVAISNTGDSWNAVLPL